MKRNLPIICAEQLLVLMAQGLQHFFAFVLSNLATAFFSQVTHLCLFRSFLVLIYFWKLYCYYFSTCFDFRKCISVFFEFFFAVYKFFFLKAIRYCAIFRNRVKTKNPRSKKEGLEWMST